MQDVSLLKYKYEEYKIKNMLFYENNIYIF